MLMSLACFAAIATAQPAPGPWRLDRSGTEARLRGVSAVDHSVAWASGNRGTCARTVDGGARWRPVAVPGGPDADFRDLHAFDADRAILLSIGAGELSRIFRTTDGGSTWTLRHVNRDPKGFLDAVAFWDADHGLALGDPVDGRFTILATDDGGANWSPIPAIGRPEAIAGEGAFAASGTCLVVRGDSQAWFGTGGGARARVFRSVDRGRTWSASDTPIRSGNASSGVFSIAFADDRRGVAVGGDYKQPDDPAGNVAITDDGGQTWRPPAGSRPAGYRSAVAVVPGTPGPGMVAVGPSGSDLSADGGRGWSKCEGEGFHAVGFAPDGAGWAVGEGGRIARFELASPRSR